MTSAARRSLWRDTAASLDRDQWQADRAALADAEWHGNVGRRHEYGAGLPRGGLVSVPTTHKPHAATVVAAHRLREEVRGFSVDQQRARIARMRRSVGVAARGMPLSDPQGHRPSYVAMLTLTYRAGVEWEACHVREMLTHLREWWRRARIARPFRYVWVAELTQAGRPHYHLAFWLPPGVKLPKVDACGYWPHGSSRIEAARDAVGYLMKYLTKGALASGKELPKGARMHGCGGLDHAVRRAKRWLARPAFVRARGDINDDWRAARGGGWFDPRHECVVPSEFRRAWLGDRWGSVRVNDHGRPFVADGPFSWLSRGVKHGCS